MGTKHLADKAQYQVCDCVETVILAIGYLSRALEDAGKLDHDCEDKVREALGAAAGIALIVCDESVLLSRMAATRPQ